MEAQHQVIETDVGRFDVIFRQMDELKREAETSTQEVEIARAEAEAIDELRRLSAEFAEAPTIHYTST